MTHSGSMSEVRKLMAGGSSGKCLSSDVGGVNRSSSDRLCLLASDFLLRYKTEFGLKRKKSQTQRNDDEMILK